MPTFIVHVLELKYFMEINIFNNAKFKSESSCSVDLRVQFFYCHRPGEARALIGVWTFVFCATNFPRSPSYYYAPPINAPALLLPTRMSEDTKKLRRSIVVTSLRPISIIISITSLLSTN